MSGNLESSVNHGIKILRLSNKNLPNLDCKALEKYHDLEHLDVSKNLLKSIPPLNLPNLKVLNCEDNSISDVTSMFNFPSLEHLYMTGNPLNVADCFIAVDQIPHLLTLNGKPVTEMKNLIQKVEEKITAKIDLLKKAKDAVTRNDISEGGEHIQLKKQFVREILQSLSIFSEIPLKFRRYKAQCISEETFKEVKASNFKSCASEKVNLCVNQSVVLLEDLKFQCKFEKKTNERIVPSSVSINEFETDPIPSAICRSSLGKGCEASRTNNKNFSTEMSPKRMRQSMRSSFVKRSCGTLQSIKAKEPNHMTESANLKMQYREQSNLKEHQDFDYDPQLFLRCHSVNQEAQNCEIFVWRAAFEPDLKDINKTTDVVAACGGNIVCFINCATGHVLKRYKNDNPSENLYALAWTVCHSNGNNRNTYTILATGGTEKKIHLIHPAMLKCYHSFKAHTKPINALVFHFSQQTWLFSGADDGNIHVWDIGQPSVPDFKASIQKLMTFEAKGTVLQIVVSSLHDALIATSSESLMVWDFRKGGSGETIKKPSREISKNNFCKSKSEGVIDGLVLVADDCIAVKVSGVASIYLVKISSLFNHSKTKKKQISFVAELVWASCDTSYNYLGFCCELNYLACGDNEGHIWLYDVSRHLSSLSSAKESEEIFSPNLVLPWPQLTFEKESLSIKKHVVINSLAFNWNGTYMVACSDSNLICIWKKT